MVFRQEENEEEVVIRCDKCYWQFKQDGDCESFSGFNNWKFIYEFNKSSFSGKLEG